LDNPLYEGLASVPGEENLYEPWPKDWLQNYRTWDPKLLKPTWPKPRVIGNVRRFNDYPCVNGHPAFSQRAVDLIRDLLEPNGELLPVRHQLGVYYFFNCRRMSNCVDLEKSEVSRIDGGVIASTRKLVFLDNMLDGLTIFKIRTRLVEVFCSQIFVDRVEEAGLQGFKFVPIWPLPEGVTFSQESYRMEQLSTKWKPRGMPEGLDVKGNTVVVRLYCERKKPSARERSAAEDVVAHLEKSLYDPDQADSESYFGDVEGHDVVDFEIRVFITAPDCDRLVAHLMPSLRSLPWPGRFHVVKRRGEFVDETAEEEYVRL